MLRKILLLLSGNAATSMMLFARNLALAWLVPVADYGIASTFAIAMAVVEMSTQFGLQVQIVQDRQGDDPRFQAALQGFQVLRGVLAGAALFLLAGPIAAFMHIPQAAWAYQVMALVPVLRSLQHFDIHRLNRDMRFAPLLLTGGLPALASLLALWPLAAWLGDYRVMLYALLLQAVLETATSHLTAERRYRLVLDRAVMGQSLRFGWPLLLNGGLLFLVFQGDKVIVGRELGIEVLAVFAMGVTLTLTPTLVMTKSVQNLFLTPLSRAAETRAASPVPFQRAAEAAIQGNILGGAVLIAGTLLLGPWFVRVALGEAYGALSWMLVWLAIQQGLRVFKSGPNLVALACGHTVNALVSNAVRAASLGLTWWLAAQGFGLPAILAVAIAAEAIGGVLSVVLMQFRVRIALWPLLPSLMAALGGVLTAGAAAAAPSIGLPQAWVTGCTLLTLVFFVLLLAAGGAFRQHLRKAEA